MASNAKGYTCNCNAGYDQVTDCRTREFSFSVKHLLDLLLSLSVLFTRFLSACSKVRVRIQKLLEKTKITCLFKLKSKKYRISRNLLFQFLNVILNAVFTKAFA